jgi:hypothetical protein
MRVDPVGCIPVPPAQSGDEMKRLFARVGIYLLLFPAVAIFSYLVSSWTWPVEFILIVGVGYALLALPAILTAVVDFAIYRFSFRPLLVTLLGVLASQFAADRLALSGMPDLNFYAAIASLTCCLVADRFQPSAK